MNRPWYHTSVVYHIYPRSFKDSNNDGIGDLEGIIEKLDYFKGTPESLGIGALWLSPVYPSPMKDFGYDVSNYCDIDPVFGTLETFDRLVAEAHKRDIKVMMDFVTNHTSSEHPWFKEARASKTSAKRDWYIWRDPKENGDPPNNWISISGGSDWTLDTETNQYYLHHFLPEQPDLNWRNPEVRAEMKKILEFWLARGVDGFRVDALNHIIEDVTFRDNPKNEAFLKGHDNPYDEFTHTYSQHQPELEEVVAMLCETIANNPHAFIVTEAYVGIPEMKRMYSWSKTKNLAPFNFNLLDMKWSAKRYRKFVDEYEASLAPDEVPTYVLGNHDRPRLASRLSLPQAKLSALLLLTLRGLPFIYYGEELGMKDGALSKSDLQDGFVKTGGPLLSRDPQRTPMQWNTSLHAGFSASKPWLPISQDFMEINVETESRDPHSMLSFYRNLIHFRNASVTLLVGGYKSLTTLSSDIYMYERTSEHGKLVVILNFSEKAVVEPLSFSGTIKISTHKDTPLTRVTNELILKPYEGVVLEITA